MRRLVTLAVITTILVSSILASTPNAFGKGQSLPTVTSKQYGYDLEQSREGIPVLISKMFFNSKDIAQNVTVVFEIRKDDLSMHLVWQEQLADPRSTAFISVSWTPQIPGEYQIRSLVVSNLTKPEVLENIAKTSFNVMSDEDFTALYSDRPTSFSIAPVEPVRASPTSPRVTFNEKQHLGDGLNTGIGEIAISDNGLYLIGVSELPPIGETLSADVLNQLVYLVASNDKGSTFSSMKYLTNNTQSLTFTSSPFAHAVNDTFIYTSWLEWDYYKDNFELVVGKSLDSGKTFTDTTRLDHRGVIPGSLDMAVSNDGKSLYIVRTEVFHDGEKGLSTLEFSRSSDYAKSFSLNQRIIDHTGMDEIRCPQIEVHEGERDSTNNTVHVTWRENSEDMGMKLLFAVSYDNGATFGPPVVIRETYTEDYDCPKFATDGDDAYLFWVETKLIYKPEDPSEILVPDTDIFFIVSRDGGRSFEPPINLSEGIGAFTTEPAILVSDGKIYAVWRDTIPEVNNKGGVNFYGNAEVIMTRSLDGGRTFEKPVNLSNNLSGSYEPEIGVHGDNVYIIWLESAFPSNAATVSLRVSRDGGNTFHETAENMVGLISETFSRPRVLASPDGEKIYILWSQLGVDESIVQLYALTGDLTFD